MALVGCGGFAGGRKGDDIDTYMVEINRYARLDRPEEERLSRLVRQGGEVGMLAAEKLACANLRLVVKIAHGFKGCGMGLSDLVAEGNIGLLKAVEKFDPDNGAKFSVYAAWWIKQSIRRAIQWQGHLVRIPRGSSQKAVLIRKVASELMTEKGREATSEEIAMKLDMPLEVVERLRGVKAIAVSLSEPAEEDGDVTLESVLESHAVDSEETGRRELLNAAIGKLGDLDKKAVEMVWGLDGGEAREDMACMELGIGLQELRETVSRAMRYMHEFMDSRVDGVPAAAVV